MEIAHIHISGVKAELIQKKEERWEIPAGIIGATIRFTFDSKWDGLSKTVVFQGCDQVKDVVNAGELVTVPQEVVSSVERKLRVGVYGVDTEGKTATPTLWVEGIIKSAAAPSGDASVDETLPVWAQMEARLSDLEQKYGIEIDETLTEAGCAADAKEVGDRFAALVPLGYLEIDDTLSKTGQAADAKTTGDALSEMLPLSGGTMTGPVAMGGNVVTGLGTPTADGDAVPLGFANRNFAPAGYGLGRAVSINAEELDSTTAPGWYHISATMTIGGYTANYWYMHVSGHGNGGIHCTQTLYAIGAIVRELKRQFNIGTPGEWEWVNPPMAAGVEYRTTERFNGKPVYVRAVDFGALPNSAQGSITVTEAYAENIIQAYGVTSRGRPIPYQTTNGTWGSISVFAQPSGTSNIGVNIYTTSDQSEHTATIILKYTTTTG